MRETLCEPAHARCIDEDRRRNRAFDFASGRVETLDRCDHSAQLGFSHGAGEQNARDVAWLVEPFAESGEKNQQVEGARCWVQLEGDLP